MIKPQTILITGTTSGIGRALLERYQKDAIRVIAVNRRSVSEEPQKNVEYHVIDISNQKDVSTLFDNLIARSIIPDIFILNAGIAKIDNSSKFNLTTFKEVFNINFLGVMTFVQEIQHRALKHKTIFSVSSCSNFVANPLQLGYHISKLNLQKSFRIFRRSDRFNVYKTAILGPVITAMTDRSRHKGYQKYVFSHLLVTADQVAESIVRFIQRKGDTLYYPYRSVLIYFVGRLVLSLLPELYSGKSGDPKG